MTVVKVIASEVRKGNVLDIEGRKEAREQTGANSKSPTRTPGHTSERRLR